MDDNYIDPFLSFFRSTPFSNHKLVRLSSKGINVKPSLLMERSLPIVATVLSTVWYFSHFKKESLNHTVSRTEMKAPRSQKNTSLVSRTSPSSELKDIKTTQPGITTALTFSSLHPDTEALISYAEVHNCL